MLSKDFDYLEKKFVVTEKFGTKCCSYKFPVSTLLEVWKHPTPNRLWVVIREGKHVNSCHNVKRSTFNRCCELGVKI